MLNEDAELTNMKNRVVHAISKDLATGFHTSFATLLQQGFWKLDIGLMGQIEPETICP